jgi:2-ketocyclohexanecarboxyl-CoA hydrolase
VRSAVDEAVAQWREELRERNPTALAIARQSSDADVEHIAGLSAKGIRSLSLYCDTDEEKPGLRPFEEKRRLGFARFGR